MLPRKLEQRIQIMGEQIKLARLRHNLRERYRRFAFNICIGNSDDHFRNHGFLLTPKGWTLSPAYDTNPTLSKYQSLLLTTTSNVADLSLLRDASEDYMLSRGVASNIISEVCDSLKNWQSLAPQQGVSKRDIAVFTDH